MIPFVGPSYQLRLKRQSAQRSVNLMPTPIESGTGKAQVYLQPVPGLRQFSGPGGGGGPDTGRFTGVYVSDSCNYGFFPRGSGGTNGSLGGGFILITDSHGTDGAHPGFGFELRLVKFDATGEVEEEVNIPEYVSQLEMTTYDHDGFIYVGPVYHLATNKLHIVKVDRETLTVAFVALLATDEWKSYHLINDPDLVIINTMQVGVGDTFTYKVVNLDSGSTVHTVDLPAEGPDDVNIVQLQDSTALLLAINGELVKCDYTTGAVLDTYTRTDLGIGVFNAENVQVVDSSIAVYAWDETPASGKIGIFNETTGALDGVYSGFPSTQSARMARWDRWVYRASDDTFYFASFTGVTAYIYGYTLGSQSITYTEELDLQFAGGGPTFIGDGSYVGSIDDSDTVYISVFTGVRAGPFGSGAGNVVFSIAPR